MIDIKHLRAFLAVAETGSVTRAGEMLHLVQPAVSRQIRLLEEDLGCELFERERYGMVLTESGRILAIYARRALLELERARAEIVKSSSEDVTGLVTLGLLPSVASVLSGRFVTALSALYPGIQARLAVGYAGTLMQWLLSGEIDAALLYEVMHSSGIQGTPLVEEPLWVIGLPASGLHVDAPLSLADLAAHKLVLPGAPHGIRTLVEHACTSGNVKLDVVAETNALDVQRALVLGGHGLTILPPIAVAEDLSAGKLVGAPIDNPPIRRKIMLALPANRTTGRHIHCAVEVLKEEVFKAIDAGAWLEGRRLLPPDAA